MMPDNHLRHRERHQGAVIRGALTGVLMLSWLLPITALIRLSLGVDDPNYLPWSIALPEIAIAALMAATTVRSAWHNRSN